MKTLKRMLVALLAVVMVFSCSVTAMAATTTTAPVVAAGSNQTAPTPAKVTNPAAKKAKTSVKKSKIKKGKTMSTSYATGCGKVSIDKSYAGYKYVAKYFTVTNKNGKLYLKAKTNNKKGTFKIKLKFAGNKKYKATTVTYTITVK